MNKGDSKYETKKSNYSIQYNIDNRTNSIYIRILGFLITLISINIMIGSVIKLYKLSSKFKVVIKSIINLFFNIW